MSRFAALFTLAVAFSAQAHAAPAACIFGETLSDLFDNTARFQVRHDVIKTFKISRMKDSDTTHPIMVEVSIVTDKQTGRVYHLNTTFQDMYDGGNTTGWIEDLTNAEQEDGGHQEVGNVVAEIGDSDISCVQ